MMAASAVSGHTYWAIALGIGFVAAVVVAILLMVLVRAVASIEKSVGGLLEIAGRVAANTANIPQLEATAPVLGQIVSEAIVQDGYMNALTDGFGDLATATPVAHGNGGSHDVQPIDETHPSPGQASAS